MEKTSKYTSQDGKEFDILIKDNVVYISQEQIKELLGLDVTVGLFSLAEFIEMGKEVDRVKTIHFKIWANLQTNSNIEFGDAITKLSNYKKE
jgi:hypothetical protein